MASLLREAPSSLWRRAMRLLMRRHCCGERARLSLPAERPERRLQVRFLIALFLVNAPFLFNLPLLAQEQKASSQEFNLILAGDSIIVTPLTVHQNDPRFMAIVNAVRQGDAAFTNLELTFPSATAYPAAQSRATWIASDPAILKELQ